MHTLQKLKKTFILTVHCKAGRFVGSVDCYAVIVLADNATFLLAVNLMVAFRPQSTNQ